MGKIGYWTPGYKIFVSIVSTRSRPVTSSTSIQCQWVESWEEAFNMAQKFLRDNRFSADNITFFTKPRLCKECIKHATQPLVFDIAEYQEECLCFIEKTPCKVHHIAPPKESE